MTGPVDPLDPVRPPRPERRRRPRAASALPPALIPGEGPRAHPTEPPPQPQGLLGAAAAHLLGQEHRRRGLRGGPETLEAARETYLKTEYSGPADRRPRAGRITRTEV